MIGRGANPPVEWGLGIGVRENRHQPNERHRSDCRTNRNAAASTTAPAAEGTGTR